MENRSDNFEFIYNHHKDMLETIVGDEYADRSTADEITDSNELLKINQKIADDLYGEYLSRALSHNDGREIHRQYNERVVSKILEPKIIPKELNLEDFGLVVVRPELIDQTEDLRDFFRRHRLDIVFEKDTTLSFDQYWGLYNIGIKFNDPIATRDFPTRTANYIGLPCHILLLKNTSDRMEPVSDYLQSLKGEVGSDEIGTIRGDLARLALERYTIDNGMNIAPSHRIALDPIGIYRGLVNERIVSDGAHKKAANQILHYAGQGVHIPDNSELPNDLKVLLDQNEIDSMLLAT